MSDLISILLVDDSPDDVELTMKALRNTKMANRINVVCDGIEAMAYLRQEGQYASAQEPSVVFLDLNMPRKDGREVLAEMKADSRLRKIPVVILTTSEAEADILVAYDLHANCYVSKPVDLKQLIKVVHALDDFWFGIVKLPTAE